MDSSDNTDVGIQTPILHFEEVASHLEASAQLVVHEQADELGSAIDEVQELLKGGVQRILEALVILEGIQDDGIELRFQVQHLLHKFHGDLLLLRVLHAAPNNCQDAFLQCTMLASNS